MRSLVAITLLLGGCSLVARFDVSRSVETNDSLCSDGIDNDGNGLVDCQDFTCLNQAVCCDQPVIVLADDFVKRACAAASCDMPDPTCQLDPSLWVPWGLPLPQLCGGGLSPDKPQQCYEVGVISQAALPLHSGLSATIGFAGQPEIAGRLIMGLTLQNQIVSGQHPCDPIEGLDPVADAVQGRTQNGYVLLAEFEHTTIGASPEITDDARHELKIVVDSARTIGWQLDGTEFAHSSAADALPPDAPVAHLGLAGRGQRARYTDVKVSDGTQCDAPGAWTPSATFQVLAGVDDGNRSWDSLQTFYPAAIRRGDQTYLYYAGCTKAPAGDGCGLEIAAGLATSSDGFQFARAMTNPLEPPKPHVMLVPGLVSNQPLDNSVTVFLSNNQLATTDSQAIFTISTTDQMQFSDEKVPSLNPGPMGTWDDAEVCCGSGFQQGAALLMWFAGHSTADPTWRIGLARSFDGGASFTEDPGNPVLAEGGREDYDGRGVTDPEVVYDTTRHLFRLWYTANGSLSRTSIGYAVSTDGAAWHKYPANPVLQPSDVGLETVGSPSVLVDEGDMQMYLHGRDSSSKVLRIYSIENRGLPPQ
jgi:hypothetical protein